jgi:hypothetical protein
MEILKNLNDLKAKLVKSNKSGTDSFVKDIDQIADNTKLLIKDLDHKNYTIKHLEKMLDNVHQNNVKLNSDIMKSLEIEQSRRWWHKMFNTYPKVK